MKKMLIVSLAIGMGFLLTSNAEAFKENTREDTGSYAHQLSLQKKLNKALHLRWSLFNKKHIERNLEEKTVPYQRAVHQASMKATNTSEISTMMNRKGAMTDYSNRKPMGDKSYIRPNRKSVFKARAVDYYVDGGDAGKEAMEANVISGTLNKVDTNKYYNTFWKRDFQSIGTLRNLQRAFYSPANAKTNSQRVRAYGKGSYQRNLTHPFVGKEIEDEYGANFSTEAE